MMNFMVSAVTADEVTENFSDGLNTIFEGAWNIIAPFAGAALVLFLLSLGIRAIVSKRR
jgi:hypothetical protein